MSTIDPTTSALGLQLNQSPLANGIQGGNTIPAQAFRGALDASISGVAESGAASDRGSVAGALNSFIQQVDAKGKEADQMRAEVLSGNSTNLHRTIIASQEASVSFSLMLEMRNKLMETYQELLRMQI